MIVTVTSENQHVLSGRVRELVQELEPDNVTINPVRDKALDVSRLSVDPDCYAEPSRALRREIRETGCRCTWECAVADNVLFSPRSRPRLAAATLR